MITSLPRSERTSSIHLVVERNDWRSVMGYGMSVYSSQRNVGERYL